MLILSCHELIPTMGIILSHDRMMMKEMEKETILEYT